MNWYYGINEQQFGPVEIGELQRLVAQGKIGPGDLVWNPSFGEQWKEAQTVSELTFTQIQKPAPAVAPSMAGELSTSPQLRSDIPEGVLENRELTRRARVSLSGNWGLCIGAIIIYSVITQVLTSFIPVVGGFVTFLIAPPLIVGLTLIYLNISRGFAAEVGQLFSGFSLYGAALGTYFLTTLFTLLWMLLLIVPGIIASISYSMVFYILNDNPGMSSMDAIRLSKQMMYGYKWQYFCLGFRFIGWILLSILTLGIGLLWVGAYTSVSYTHFYEMVRRNYNANISK